MTAISLLDLTAEQAARVEDAVGAPIDDWGGVSKGRLLPLVLHELRGGELAEWQAKTIGELMEMVTTEDTPEGNAEGTS